MYLTIGKELSTTQKTKRTKIIITILQSYEYDRELEYHDYMLLMSVVWHRQALSNTNTVSALPLLKIFEF